MVEEAAAFAAAFDKAPAERDRPSLVALRTDLDAIAPTTTLGARRAAAERPGPGS